MEEGGPIAEVLNLLSGFVETVATVVKRCVPVAKNVAEEVADFAKCVAVESSVLQVVLICASFAEVGMEIKRAKVEWHCIYARLEYLPGAIGRSMFPVLYPDGQVDELLVCDRSNRGYKQLVKFQSTGS